MAIIWTDPLTGEKSETTHVGRVLSTRYKDSRIMSDVYCMARYATVVLDDGTTEEIWISDDSGMRKSTPTGVPTVDILPMLKIRYLIQQLIQKAIQDEQDRRRYADQEALRRNTPAKGKVMTVVSGRKVPRGTTGTVFWIMENRVGLALSGAKNAKGHYIDVAWVDAKHLAAVDPKTCATPV